MSDIIPSDEDGVIQEEEMPTEYEVVPEDDVEDKFLEEWDSDEMVVEEEEK